MSFTPYNLLRRTFLVVAAFAAIGSMPAIAQVKTDTGSTLCTSYSNIQLSPSGGVTVTGCSSTTTTTPTPTPTGTTAPDGTFTVNGAATIDASTTAYLWYSVSRSGSLGTSSSAATIYMTATGGCKVPTTPMQFAAGSGDTYQAFTVVAPTDSTGKIYNTTCTIAIQQQNPALTLGNGGTGSIQVQVVNGTGTAPTSGGGGTTSAFNCPAVPVDANSNFSLTWGGGVNGFLWLKSGQIGYTALPAFSSWSSTGAAPQSESANVAGAITTGSASQGTVEVSINHCPGVIDTNGTYTQGVTGGKCYTTYPMDQSVHNLPWFQAVGNGGAAATDSMANTYGICEAYASNGPWYVNVRYTYSGAGPYDMAFQWNWSYFNP